MGPFNGVTFHKPLKHCDVYTHTNTSLFLMILFDPYFVHVLECVPYVCLKIPSWIPLYWPKQYELHDLAISGQQHNIMLQPIWTMIHAYTTNT